VPTDVRSAGIVDANIAARAIVAVAVFSGSAGGIAGVTATQLAPITRVTVTLTPSQ